MKTSKSLFAILIGSSLLASGQARALDQVVRPYQGIRSAGMGGTLLTTGLYDENFFGNPARALANPKFKITPFDFMIEVNSSSISRVGDLASSGDPWGKLASSSGQNNHLRIQTTLPSFYFPAGEEGKWAYAVGLHMSTQADMDLRNSFQIDPTVISDIGPSFTLARKLLDEDRLGVGMTAHATYRVSSNRGFTFVDLIKGSSISPTSTGGQGAHLDFDVGGTYVLPIQPWESKVTVGATINNLLGGNYSNLGLHPVSSIPGAAPAQPRTLGLGITAAKAQTGAFTDTVAAFEIRDIGNNPNGSLFKTLHIGGETHYGLTSIRLGINQGYLTAGFGFALKIVNIDLATYGEEMSLNAGGLEDRRFALKLEFQI